MRCKDEVLNNTEVDARWTMDGPAGRPGGRAG